MNLTEAFESIPYRTAGAEDTPQTQAPRIFWRDPERSVSVNFVLVLVVEREGRPACEAGVLYQPCFIAHVFEIPVVSMHVVPKAHVIRKSILK